MKKALILVFSVVLLLAFATVASANEAIEAENSQLKIYFEEKIMPIVAGVITSIMALVGTLKGIFKALSKLESAKDSFDLANEEISKSTKDELSEIRNKYEEIKIRIESVAGLENQINDLKRETGALILQISNLSKIASLGFAQSKELVVDGRAREIAILAKQNEVENEEI